MAIDYTGKTATSTTGTIGATPFVPQAPDTSNLGVPEVSTERTKRKEINHNKKLKSNQDLQ